MGITQDQVEKAFEYFEDYLNTEEANLEALDKSSESDLDQPEGADMGWGQNAHPKMSSEANDDGGSNKTTESGQRTGKKSDKKSPSAAKKGLNDDNDMEKGDMKCSKCDYMADDKSGMSSHMDKKHMGKSFADGTSEEIQGQIDVSDFLKSFYDGMGDYIDKLRDSVENLTVKSQERMGDVEEMVADVQHAQANIGIVLKAICERMRIIEDQPAHEPRADTVAKADGQYAERGFQNNDQEGGEKVTLPGLSENPLIAKAQVTEILSDMVMKGEAKDLDVISYETGGFISPEMAPKVMNRLAGNNGNQTQN